MDTNDKLMDDIFAGLQGKQPQIDNPKQLTDDIMKRIQPRFYHTKWITVLRICSTAASLLLIFGYAVLHFSTAEISCQNEGYLYSYQKKISSEMTESQSSDYLNYIQKKVLAKNNIYEQLKKMSYENNN